MASGQKTFAEGQHAQEATVSSFWLPAPSSQTGSRKAGQSNESASSTPNTSASIAASDAPTTRFGRSTKPSGLIDSIWATPSALTTSPPTTTPTMSSPGGAPRGSARSARTTGLVDAVPVDGEKKLPTKLRGVSSKKSVVKLISVGTGIPHTPSVTHTGQKQATDTSPPKTAPAGDDFELVEHDELDEDFDVVSGEDPSSSNGTSRP